MSLANFMAKYGRKAKNTAKVLGEKSHDVAMHAVAYPYAAGKIAGNEATKIIKKHPLKSAAAAAVGGAVAGHDSEDDKPKKKKKREYLED